MRRKTLLTATLCVVLAAASHSVSPYYHSARYVRAESAEEKAPSGKSEKTEGAAPVSTPDSASASETTPKQTEPAAQETTPDSGSAGEQGSTGSSGSAGEQGSTGSSGSTENSGGTGSSGGTESAGGTEGSGGTESSGGAEGSGGTENSGNTESPGDAGSSGSTEGSETASPDTNPDTDPQTGGTEAQQTETSGETLPTEAPSTETPPTEAALAEIDMEDEPLIVPETWDEKESETEKKLTNEELIARQQIVIPPEIPKEFRFTKVEKQYAIVKNPEGTQIYEEKSTDATEVGALNYYGCCFILEDQKDGWYYVESGNVRGFVRTEEVVVGEVANRIVRIKGAENLPPARLLVARPDNAAFTYTHTTVQPVMAAPEYALAAGDVNIYEQKKDSARVIGTMSEKDLCYILDKTDDTWVFVESGDARGFVEKKKLTVGQEAEKAVSEAGEENMPLAETLVEPEDNKACYFTLASVKEASQGAKTREAIVGFARQFLGNSYVWGGTSLTDGADCSGFVQSIYSYFGYSLPRVAEDQSVYGMQIPVSSAEPGDLIFYARNGYVYHVSMYIGDGKVIHAAGKRVGIITSEIGGNAVWATRVIKD